MIQRKMITLPSSILEQVSYEGMSMLMGGNTPITSINNGNNCNAINNGRHCDVVNNASNCSVVNNGGNCNEKNNFLSCPLFDR